MTDRETDDDRDAVHLVDPGRVFGNPDDGYLIAESVRADGQVDYWGFDAAALTAAAPGTLSPAYWTPPRHERLGPLDEVMWWRVWCSTPLRCGARTRAGGSCRRVVWNPGDRCHQHQPNPRGLTRNV